MIASANDTRRPAREEPLAGDDQRLRVLIAEEGDLAEALTAFRRAGQHGSREVAELAHAILLELDEGNGGPGAEESGGGHDGL